ncbi:MAG TPA: hypothetical protein VHE53_05235 [Patescibacteria group bacterium]|nr:hypothetical protein [Patescibacteria group bacterium]
MPILFDNTKNKVKEKTDFAKSHVRTNNFADRDKSSEETKKVLSTLIHTTCEPIFKTKTVFPFTLFPDEVIVDREKISIVTKVFFSSERIQSVMFNNISDLYVDTNLFFGALKIIDKYFVQNVVTVRYLPKEDAVKIRKIIQGFIVVQKEEIDVSRVPDKELLPYIEEIGSAH